MSDTTVKVRYIITCEVSVPLEDYLDVDDLVAAETALLADPSCDLESTYDIAEFAIEAASALAVKVEAIKS